MSQWVKEWPTEPGWYWFYGLRYSREQPELNPVQVWRAGDGNNAYVVRGSFLYKSEGAEGVWQPMALPDLPGEECACDGGPQGEGMVSIPHAADCPKAVGR